MNIYQHLLFLVPTVFCIWFGFIRFFDKLKDDTSKANTGLSGIAATVGIVLFVLYANLNRELPVDFYNYLGTL